MSVDILENSPFTDFLFPGIALLLINGFFSLFCAYLALNFDNYSGATTIVLGSVMLIGGATQFFWIGWVSWVHSAFTIIGLIEVGLGYFLYILQKENYSVFGKFFDSNFN
jgi:CHASE2 domain-containing sensor protein